MVDETIRKIARHLALAAAKSEKIEFRQKIAGVLPRQYFTKMIRPEKLLVPPAVMIQPDAEKLNFGRLSHFIEDPKVSLIECSGPKRQIKIKRGSAVVSTKEFLILEEIMDIINQFSRLSMTPLTPMFKAAVGNLSITAFVSNAAEPRFMITKSQNS